MLEIVLRPEAEQDIRDIANYSEANWGAFKAKLYVEGIVGKIGSLAEYPDLGTRVDGLPGPYRKLISDTHRIFYRGEAAQVIIVRILHARMDVPDLE
jgi:toxin ParE1/3/4